MAESRPTLQRPRDLAQMQAALAKLHSEQSLTRAARFETHASDVFVATYPKCGTTWMQQIVHGLRSGGDMDFEEICGVVPWLEAAWDLDIDPAAQAFVPRAYKTHYDWAQVPKGARYLYVIRDPRDVLVSFFHFFEGWMFEPGTISLETFAEDFFFVGSRSGRYWEHLRSWWPQREAPHTLWFSYERMRRDLPAVVAEVAAFISADPSAVERATEQARFDFMRAHETQFDDHLVRGARDRVCGVPPSKTSKLRAGRSGDARKLLTPQLHARFDALWKQELEPVIGLPNYTALEASLA